VAFGNKDKNDKTKTEKPKKAELPKDLPVRLPTNARGKGGQGQGRG
jgi:hypothetical protein